MPEDGPYSAGLILYHIEGIIYNEIRKMDRYIDSIQDRSFIFSTSSHPIQTFRHLYFSYHDALFGFSLCCGSPRTNSMSTIRIGVW
jgi:hypothetical protein